MTQDKAPLELVREELSELSAYRVPPEPAPIKLDANESPWPLSEVARERIQCAIAGLEFNRYPDPSAQVLREALAERFGGKVEAYVVGAGSDEIIALLASALSRPRSGNARPVVVYPTPTFVMYGITSRAHGFEVVEVPLDLDWQLDANAMRNALQSKAPNLVYYASPNNPTGNRFDDEVLRELIVSFPDTLHIIDEAYAPFSKQSCAQWCDSYPNLGVMGTFSKVGLAALRVGWIRLHRDLVQELEKVRQPFNLNTLSQTIATLALRELANEIRQAVNKVSEERERCYAALQKLNLVEVYPSEANFILVKSERAEALQGELRARDIGVRAFGSAPGSLASCLRFTIGTPSENNALIQALEELLG